MAKKKAREEVKLKTYHVPINVSICGHETVKAKDWQDAVDKARDQYFGRDHDNYNHGVGDADIDVDFPEYEDEVELDEEDEDGEAEG